MNYKDTMPDVSIVILTFNQREALERSLPIICSQDAHFAYEVIIIDSSSNSLIKELAGKFNARWTNIDKSEFHHAKTRNLGMRMSNGRYVVFLTGDAIPYNKFWLKNLVSPLEENPNVIAIFSKQIPYPNCHPMEAREMEDLFSDFRVIKQVDLDDPYQIEQYRKNLKKFIVFSNVSSCYIKSYLEKRPFREDIIAAEDQEWCRHFLEQGMAFQYEPSSVVLHSHNESLREVFRRCFMVGQAFRKIWPDYSLDSHYNLKPANILGLLKAVKVLLGDYYFLFGYKAPFIKKISWFFNIPFFRLARKIGFENGFKRTC